MFSNQRGQALIIVMLLTATIFILGGAALAIGSSARKNATEEIHQKKAYYIAEAGVERALSKLRAAPDWRDIKGEELMAAYAGGQIESVVVKDAGVQDELGKLVEIESTGVFRSARRTLKVELLVSSLADLFGEVSLLPDEGTDPDQDTDFYFLGNLTIKNTPGSSETGKVIIRGNLHLGNIERLDADIYLSGRLEKHKECNFTGNCFENYPIPPFPQLDQEELRQKAKEKGHFYTGSTKFGGKNEELTFAEQDIYFVDGDLGISGIYSGGPAIIATTGDIEIDGDLKMASDAENLLVLVCFGDDVDEKVISVKGNAKVVDALIVSYGGFNIHGNTTLHGGMVAKHLVKPENKLNGNLTIECDPELVRHSLFFDLPEQFTTKTRIRSWRET